MQNKKIQSAIAIIFSVFAIFLSTSFVFENISEKIESNLQTQNEALSFAPFEKKEEKPQYYYTNKNYNQAPKISAEAYLVGDLDTGEVILAKNQEEKLPIASISKLMTALVASFITDKDNTVTISKKAVATPGTNGGLRSGEKIKTEHLLYPLLLESSNDAAEALAEHFGRDSFIRKMNEFAESLKMENTKYEDPSGLSPQNFSTVADLFKFSGYLHKNKEDLLKITTQRSFSIKKHSWSNISRLLNENGYFGGKTGYTDTARETIISLFDLPLGRESTRPIGIALLKSRDRVRDVKNILQFLKKNIYYGGEKDANTDWVTEKVRLPDVSNPDFVTFTFGGDIMLDRGVKNSVLKNFGGDYSKLFEKKDLSNLLEKSDIVFANLEGTASDKGTDLHNLYSFRMDPGIVPTLAGTGFDIVSIANNHVGDWGHFAYTDTLARLKENEIAYTGGGQNLAEAQKPTIIEKYGMKIGFLGFSDVGPEKMKAETEKAGILLSTESYFDETIKNAAKQVDYLVVSIHGGEEYKEKHNARQENLAHRAIDNGAKLVIGHHPHVIEDTEVYKNGFIAYSLGNFIFDQSWSEPTMRGMLLQVKLGRDGSLSVRKNTVKLNKSFQVESVTLGKEEEIKF